MEEILDEIERAAERCTDAAEAVRDTLEAGDLGFVAEILSMLMSDEPPMHVPRPRRAPSPPSAVVPSPPIVKPRTAPDPGHAGRWIERLRAASSTEPTPASNPEQDKTKVAAALAKLRELRPSFSSDANSPNGATPLDNLSGTLDKAEHPAVKAARDANDTLEYIEIRILPKIDVLSEEFRDDGIRAHHGKIVLLAKRRGEAHKVMEALILELFKGTITQLDAGQALKFANLALGPGRRCLMGLFLGCVVLGEIGAHLKKIGSRVQTRISMAAHKSGATKQRAPAPRQGKPPETNYEARTDRESQMKQSGEQPVDFVILTAIDIELRAVRAAFGLTIKDRIKMGTRVYWRGTVALSDTESYSIVVGLASDVANTDAALTAAAMLNDWNPNAALLVGIAATTAPGKVKLGDVVVGREVYYYERGKATRRKTLPEPKIIPADLTLLNNLQSMEWDGKLDVARPEGADERSTLHFGVIACGEQVIADAAKRDRIVSAHRKVLAVEMEGYGFSLAVWHRFEKVRCLIIRGISDDGSENKDDRWHSYAAAASANVAKQFLLDRPLEPRSHASAPSVVSDATGDDAHHDK